MVKIILTPVQVGAVNANFEHVLVRGIPGSGKTIVLVSKIKSILEENPNAKILFITYNNTLKNYIINSLEELECDLNNIEVSTYYTWAKETLIGIDKDIKNPYQLIEGIIQQKYQEARIKDGKSHRFFEVVKDKMGKEKDNPYEVFLREEYSWLKGKGIRTRSIYLKEKRTGRGEGLQENDRNIVYDYVESIDTELAKQKFTPNEVLAIEVLDNIEAIKKNYVYDGIFIDEAQDLTQHQMKTMSHLLQKGQLCIAADLGQKIYKTEYTWKSADIRVRGGRIVSLDLAHRCTVQVMDLATSLLKHDPLVKSEGELREYNAERTGPKPQVIEVVGQKWETDTVSQLVREMLSDNQKVKIGVLALANKSVTNIINQLERAGLPVCKIDKDGGDLKSAGVKVMTMHAAKGLEFDHVIITGLNAGKFPPMWNCTEADKQERIEVNRRLLYVSMTRAKQQLYITYKGKPTQYIGEMYPTYYEFKKI